PPIYGDAYLVQRAISNLIANAIRYTPPGGVIDVSTCANQDWVEVHVTDSGEGIAPEHLPHIFERFYRADDSRTRQSGGRGLGLAIVRQIMDQHGGDVRVQSNPGSGSTFTLYWKTQNMPS
ncbi:MAG TPA: ATP-binding protein, partial [Aggregatilineales bacterium]|nr:ATP-binding protein [Aggregatilineales bacterium]